MGLFVKGQSGNPAGRTPGSKNKFKDQFWNDLYAAWEECGAQALRAAVKKNPLGFCQMAASMLPKEETHEHQHIVAVRLWTPEESRAYLTAQDHSLKPITLESKDTAA